METDILYLVAWTMLRLNFNILGSSKTVHCTTTKRTFQYVSQTSSTTPLKGKTIIVTGASRGIGLAIAETYVYRGASKVVLIGRNEATLTQVRDAINEEPDVASRGHVYRVGDVADRQFWVELGKEWVSLSRYLMAISSSSDLGFEAKNDIERHRHSCERRGHDSLVVAGDDETGIA